MAKLVSMKEWVEKTLEENKKPWTKFYVMGEEKTGINRLYLFAGKDRLTPICVTNHSYFT